MEESQITFAEGIIQVIIQLAPVFVILIVLFVIFSWLRVLVDNMSGRGL